MKAYSHKDTFRTFIAISLFAILAGGVATSVYTTDIPLVASIFGAPQITTNDLLSNYHTRPITVLVVPGHDPSSFGTMFNGIKEAELNTQLGTLLTKRINDDPNFIAYTTHNPDGTYMDWFSGYITQNLEAIQNFYTTQHSVADAAREKGAYKDVSTVGHVSAKSDVVNALYGVNKWANENNIDIVLHLHFNDYGGRKHGRIGKYTGFTIYTPEKQLPNHEVSSSLAHTLRSTFDDMLGRSTLPNESSGIVEDQELIAIGSNGTRDGASLLIEYGYIYETPIQEESIKDTYITELAHQTYRGLKTFFEPTIRMTRFATLPHTWNAPLTINDKGSDVLRLQLALRTQNAYPPQGRSLSDCPISGYYGACTAQAVSEFQERFAAIILSPLGLTSGTHTAGLKTLELLDLTLSK